MKSIGSQMYHLLLQTQILFSPFLSYNFIIIFKLFVWLKWFSAGLN